MQPYFFSDIKPNPMQRKLNCVLLIDDDEATNFINEMVIEESGKAEEVVKIQSAFDALTFLKSEEKGKHPQPDLIFLDINMPGMDGWEFLEEYEKLDDGMKAKVILVMLTTSVNPDDKKKAEQFNIVDNFMLKPLTVDDFNSICEEYFDLEAA